MLALTHPWGFSLTDLHGPVSIWFGREDALCPRAHGDWLLAHIPGAESFERPGGHLLDETTRRHLYRWLLSA